MNGIIMGELRRINFVESFRLPVDYDEEQQEAFLTGICTTLLVLGYDSYWVSHDLYDALIQSMTK